MRLNSALLNILFLCSFAGCNTEVSEVNDILPSPRNNPFWLDRHNSIVENLVFNQKIIFIGDSLTHLWSSTGYESWQDMEQLYNTGITNMGFSGDNVGNVIWRLTNGEFPFGINPEYVVLMIGINNMGDPRLTAAGIDRILKIIHERSPSTKILLFSLLPCFTANSLFTTKNTLINNIIKDYDRYHKTKYVDIVPYYINGDEKLKSELFGPAGIHLSLSGYKVWQKEIEKAIAALDSN